MQDFCIFESFPDIFERFILQASGIADMNIGLLGSSVARTVKFDQFCLYLSILIRYLS